MKLIYCTQCSSVFNLKKFEKYCDCKQSSGRYTDDLHAIIRGPCIPVGFQNSSFINALKNQPELGLGFRFDAFVIPKEVETISRE